MQQQLQQIQSCFEKLMEHKTDIDTSVVQCSESGPRLSKSALTISDGAMSASTDTDDTHNEPADIPDGN